jgi:hypothetical protein
MSKKAISLLIFISFFGCTQKPEAGKLNLIELATEAVNQILSEYKNDGISEIGGIVDECYQVAIMESNRKIKDEKLQRCMMMDRVGYQIDNAVASQLKAEPIEYFSVAAYARRFEAYRVKIGLSDEEALSLIKAVDISLSDEVKIGK